MGTKPRKPFVAGGQTKVQRRTFSKAQGSPSLADDFLSTTGPKARGCAICLRAAPITEETASIIDLAGKTGRGPVTTMRWLKEHGLWPKLWSEQRIAAHWRHG